MGRRVRLLPIVVAVAMLVTGSVASAETAQPLTGQMRVRPKSGPPGTTVDVQARNLPPLGPHCFGVLDFVDSARAGTLLYQFGLFTTSFELEVSIPASASTGVGMFIVLLIGIRQGSHCQPGFNEQVASARFMVMTSQLISPATGMLVRPRSGPPGTTVDVQAHNLPTLGNHCFRDLDFNDSARDGWLLYRLGGSSSFEVEVSIPSDASVGVGKLRVIDVGLRLGSHCQIGPNEQRASTLFTVIEDRS